MSQDFKIFRNLSCRLFVISGVSLSAVAAATALFPAPAASEDRIIRQVSQGAIGTNAYVPLIGSNTPATAGGVGLPIGLTNGFTATGARSTAVELGSVGGAGGAGAAFGPFDEPGADGGAAGAVSLVQQGALSGAGTQATQSALVRLYSQGGAGGFGQQGVGKGADGGSVTLTLQTIAQTTGSNFAALWARSAGGNAGGGGSNVGRIAVDKGGAAGPVTVVLSAQASARTSGDNAPAIIAESLGGDGSVRGSGTAFSRPYVTNGGVGGTVSFTNAGSVETTGNYSTAVLLQSVGGRGGAQPDAGGQPGATGGNGGVISVTQAGSITTSALYAYGLIAQSVGGSGGKGGGAVFSGGDGGAAGNGNTVTVTNAGAIHTSGDGGTGLLLQSIGGGNALGAFQAQSITPATGGGGSGGSGGLFFFGAGGTGGTGGDGGKVTFSNSGSILTEGAQAYGVLAQSIGGGGGSGGPATARGILLGYAAGGAGGGGGNGGTVEIAAAFSTNGVSAPTITTRGAASSAIVAQSVGGSGGAGGTAAASTVGVLASVSVAVGGAGGKGGNGGRVTVDNTSVLSTAGGEANGIEARSVGGGGGKAGNASSYALAVSPPEYPSVAISYAMGGAGGDGGNGGQVAVNNYAAITTTGGKAYGIFAQSIGGGGGAAGSANSVADLMGLYQNVGVAIGLGGSGGGGGKGDAVTVTNASTIQTQGAFSHGILAMSVGGGGGDGGTASTTTASGISWNDTLSSLTGALPIADAMTANYTVGGTGGKGGAGGAVEVTNLGSVLTTGSDSRGLFAQSVGGGGGNAGGYLGSGGGKLAGSLNMGGTGGDGGNGGKVTVTNVAGASIETQGAGSAGIFAQSVGGGGGAGGAFAGKTKSAVSFGDAPDQFIIQVAEELLKVNKLVSTQFGDDAKKAEDAGFFDKKSTAQQRLSTAKDVLKAFKAAAGKDKTVLERLYAAGTTAALNYLYSQFGDVVKSTLKQFSSADAVKLKDGALTVAIGGSGAKGGDGGEVTVVNQGDVLTLGNASAGIFAQSIGGGGGAGGGGYAAGANQINLTGSVGGSGGGGGAGGAVSVTNNGSISTLGGGAFGIFAQSVGGGGGVGGGAISADGISVSGNLKIGGDAGKSSDGGRVQVVNSASITTSGNEAHGIVAQSVGGGGGVFFINREDPLNTTVIANSLVQKEGLDAAYDVLKDLGLVQTGTVADRSTTILPTPQVNYSIGGTGGGGGNGGAVTVIHSGEIATFGTGAFGIFAQSIGGGGGFGSDASSAGKLQIGVGVGGIGGAAGNGGDVTVVFGGRAAISTAGDGASAVFLQSIGGGGGYGGAGEVTLGNPLKVVRDGTNSGSGGLIWLSMQQSDAQVNIQTSGARAHGIFAQSLGGGGGTVFDLNGTTIPVIGDTKRAGASGSGGWIFMTLNGAISTSGRDSYGIFAQSGVQTTNGALDPSRSAGGSVRLTLDAATITGGSGTGAGIRIDGGAYNEIVLRSASASVSALSGTAISTSFGIDNVFNSGTIVGTVNLASGGTTERNTFDNQPGGTYRSLPGSVLNLGGADSTFRSSGILDIGGVGTIAVLPVLGGQSFLGGTLLVDINTLAFPNKNDVLVADRVQLSNPTIQPNVFGGLLPGDYTVVKSKDLAAAPVAITSNAGSPISWSARVADNAVVVKPAANFVGAATFPLNPNEASVAAYLQRTWDASYASQAPLFASMAKITSALDYQQALDSLSPEGIQAPAVGQTLAARSAMGSAMSCPIFSDTGLMVEESQCMWSRVIGAKVQQFDSPSSDGFSQNTVSFRIGAQWEVAPDWFLGATAAYSDSSYSSNDGYSSASGTSGDLSLALKHQMGPWLLAAAVTAGYGNYDTIRTLDIGPDTWISENSSQVWTSGLRLRAAYEFALPGFYLRPYVDADMIYTYVPGTTDTDGSAARMSVSAMREWTFSISPAVEIGTRMDLSPTSWLRPYASVGATFLSNSGLSTNIAFDDSVNSPLSFTSTADLPNTLMDVGAGLQFFANSKYELRGEYKAQIGADFLAQEGSVRMSVRF